MGGAIALVILAVWLFLEWVFYQMGASIAEGKGRSRSSGWWAVFFGIPALIVLALLPSVTPIGAYIPPAVAPKRNVSEQIERLAALKTRGALSDQEFEKAKRALLEGG